MLHAYVLSVEQGSTYDDGDVASLCVIRMRISTRIVIIRRREAECHVAYSSGMKNCQFFIAEISS
jgi:hypothetical protein